MFAYEGKNIDEIMVTQEQVKDILSRAAALYGYLDIDRKQIQIETEEEKTHDPSFWDDPKAAACT